MKKTLIIAAAIFVLLTGLLIWGYLLLYGTPAVSDDVFASLGFGNATPDLTRELVETDRIEPVEKLAVSEEPLQQLTTKAVAGFGFYGTSSDIVRFAERGTGHLYEINLLTNSERRLSGATIPLVVDAEFSPNGGAVALLTEDNNRHQIYAALITNDMERDDYTQLPVSSSDPGFKNNHTVRYMIHDQSGARGYEYDLRLNEATQIFALPLQDITPIWATDIYVYPNPTQLLPGTLYSVSNKLTPVLPTAFGFVGGVSDSYYFYTAIEQGRGVSRAVDRLDGDTHTLAVTYLPEKCTIPLSFTMWCATSFVESDDDFIENWYQGAIASNDGLWQVNIEDSEAILVSNFEAESSRSLDVDQITTDSEGQVVLLRDKLTNTLWRYDARLD